MFHRKLIRPITITTIIVLATVVFVILSENIAPRFGTASVGGFDSDYPVIVSASAQPQKVKVGDILTITAEIKDKNGISKALAKMPYGGGADEISLSLISGDIKSGKWQGKWKVHNTINKEYITVITAINIIGLNSSAEVNWWDDIETVWFSGWNHRKQMTINGSTAGVQTDYQMKLTVHKGAGSDSGGDVYLNGNCLDNFNDIRFTKSDGSSELDHWREEYTSGDHAVFWIEFDSIPESPSTANFYIYYDKSDAGSGSNGANTFILDDFERGNDGDEIGGDWTEAQGVVEISTGQAYKGTRAMKLEGVTGAGQQPRAQISLTPSNNQAIRMRVYKEDASNYQVNHGDATHRLLARAFTDEDIDYNNGAWQDTGTNITADSWCLFEFNDFDWTGHTYDIIYEGSSIQDDAAMDADTTKTNVLLIYGFPLDGADTWIDDFIVRNWCSPEPTWGTWGGEEARPTAPGISPSGGGFLMF